MLRTTFVMHRRYPANLTRLDCDLAQSRLLPPHILPPETGNYRAINKTLAPTSPALTVIYRSVEGRDKVRRFRARPRPRPWMIC